MARAPNPTYKINLLEVIKRAIPDPKIQDAIRPTLGESPFKTLFGQRIVDEIVTRTRDKNIDKNGGTLGTYSKEYKASLVFQIYKSGQRKVDLTLTGEMLESLRSNNTRFMIVVDLEESQRGKAKGHITGKLGKYGRAEPRDFLGLPNKEVDKIFLESIKDYRDLTKLTLEELSV
jgi:hypothetical protein